MRFTEAVDQDSITLQLSTSASTAPVLGAATLSADGRTVTAPVRSTGAEPHTISVGWRVVSAIDGHETTGLLIFTVATGRPPETPTLLTQSRPEWFSVTLRLLALLGLVTLLVPAAIALLRLPSPRGVLPVVGGLVAAMALVISALERGDLSNQPTRRLLMAAGVTLIVLLLTSAGAHVRRAASWSGRALSLHATAVAAWVAAIALMTSSGHAAADRPARSLIVDTAHTSLSLTWAASLVALTWGGCRAPVDSALRRFSRAAVAGVVLLAATGLVLSWDRIGGARRLSDTDYGVLVLTKMGLAATAVTAAAFNQLVMLPRLPNADWHRVGRWVLSVEVAVLIAAIGVASALALTPPADGPELVEVAPRAVMIDERMAAGATSILVTGAILGEPDDTLVFEVTDATGAPASDIARLILDLQVTRDGETAATRVERVDALPLEGAPGTFSMPASLLSTSGVWTVELVVRRVGREDEAATLTVDTSSWTFPAPRFVESGWTWPIVPMQSIILAVLAVGIATVGCGAVMRSRSTGPTSAAIILGAVSLIAVGFGIQALTAMRASTSGHDNVSPIASTDLEAAAATYRTYCLACHGPDGAGIETGDDPLHAHDGDLNVVDADTRRLSDGDLHWSITWGVPGTGMLAYDVALTDEDRWSLVAYLRFLPGLEERPATVTPTPGGT